MYITGLIILSVAIGSEFKTTYGFMVLAVGLIAAALVEYLDSGLRTPRTPEK